MLAGNGWLECKKASNCCRDGTFERYEAALPFFEAVLIPKHHRAHLFWRKETFSFFAIWFECCFRFISWYSLTLTHWWRKYGKEPKQSPTLLFSQSTLKRKTRSGATLDTRFSTVRQIRWYHLILCREQCGSLTRFLVWVYSIWMTSWCLHSLKKRTRSWNLKKSCGILNSTQQWKLWTWLAVTWAWRSGHPSSSLSSIT